MNTRKSFAFKRILRILARTSLVVLITLLVYLVAVFSLPKIRFDSSAEGNKTFVCYLKSNGSHVDIVMPIRSAGHSWLNYLNTEHIAYRDSSFQWVAFGWGDKNFYLNTPTWGDLTVATAFKAAFWLSSGALHVTFYKELSEAQNCVPIKLSAKQNQELFDFIREDFKKDDEQQIIHIPTAANYGPCDAFYESKKRYSLFHTCNTWVNDALKATENKHCLWTALEFGVMDLYRKK